MTVGTAASTDTRITAHTAIPEPLAQESATPCSRNPYTITVSSHPRLQEVYLSDPTQVQLHKDRCVTKHGFERYQINDGMPQASVQRIQLIR
jgi:hypothetical protein